MPSRHVFFTFSRSFSLTHSQHRRASGFVLAVRSPIAQSSSSYYYGLTTRHEKNGLKTPMDPGWCSKPQDQCMTEAAQGKNRATHTHPYTHTHTIIPHTPTHTYTHTHTHIHTSNPCPVVSSLPTAHHSILAGKKACLQMVAL